MKNKHNVEIYDNGYGSRIALELFNGMRWSMTVEKAIELKESLEYGITSASPNNAMHSDGEGCDVLEKASIPGDEETFNNGHGW